MTHAEAVQRVLDAIEGIELKAVPMRLRPRS